MLSKRSRLDSKLGALSGLVVWVTLAILCASYQSNSIARRAPWSAGAPILVSTVAKASCHPPRTHRTTAAAPAAGFAQVDSEIETKDWPQTIEMVSGPTRTRTWDQRIMSPSPQEGHTEDKALSSASSEQIRQSSQPRRKSTPEPNSEEQPDGKKGGAE